MFVTMKKIFCQMANSVPVATGSQESMPLPPFEFAKNTFFGTSWNDKKTDNDAKRNNNI